MKLSKKTKAALLIGVPLLIGGYLIYKQLKPKPNPNPYVPTTPPITPPTPPPPAPTGSCRNYIVTTAVSNLNIRESTSTSSAYKGSLAKGSTVSAKQSSTSGWMELCDGRGFVSGQYLTLTS
jgi:uncharacterized protein YgiM (DUF1202 family)